MANFAKEIAFFVLLTVCLCSAFGYVANERGPNKLPTGAPQVIKVDYSPEVLTPIQFTAENYNGPYDPADPTGRLAAAHRAAKMRGEETSAMIKSYIPDGFEDLAKKELVKLAMNEGRRFTFAHPIEAANLLGIVTKGKALYKSAESRIERAEKKNSH